MRLTPALGLLAVLAAGPAFAQSATPIGVAECDDFLTKYDQCLNTNVPAANRAQVGAAVTQMRDSWRQMAQNPQTRPMLGPQCTQMAQQMAQSMSAYNCRF
ncbi:hypothetical protein GWK16_15460 [Roseomonas sp. JC162]|uniref:Uncharacterized protein n=1 Tax=Neoroseomonas marina TaxID=1232220 RepID=A0A848EDI4_9PROT|nr:hypothetical protein [Neoroseomonas marina]NMJ42644.1 hypothetical protein [Neoroseomonas marina]